MRAYFNTMVLALTLLFVLELTGCKDLTQPVRYKVTGYITMVGNEPFTRLALRTDDNRTLLLNCDEKTRQLLQTRQGWFVTVYYSKISYLEGQEVIEVEEIIWGQK